MAKDDRPFIGVDLGGTKMLVGILDPKDKIIAREKSKTKVEDGPDAVIKRIEETILEAMKQASLKAGDVGGIAIGAPGVVDIHTGVVVYAPNLCWNKLPLGKILKEKLGIAVTIDNDVNVGTWGEYVLGAGQGYEDILGVFVGTGIGAGLVLGGRLYHGHYMSAGEIGHIVLHAGAPWGKRTLEQNSSRTAIVKNIVSLIESNHQSIIKDIVDDDLESIRSRPLAEAVEKEDPLTVRVIKEAGILTGVAIANNVTMLSLPCVVVGGGLTEALGKRYLEWVQKGFEDAVFPPQLRSCRIVASKLGDDAGILGAALLARQRLGLPGKTP